MGVVKYSPGIEFVKGSLAKPVKKDGHNHGDYLIGTHREAATENPNCTRIYIRKGNTYGNVLPMSADARAARTRFAAVAAAVKARKENVSTLTADVAAFQAQKETGKKTFKAYLWKVCGDAYDQSNG